MKLIKKTAEYSVLERRDGRHAVKSKNGKMINGDDKVAILIAEKLVKAPEPKPEPEPEAETEATEEADAEAE
ncbi:MAG: hypothetical protein ACRBEE_09910 [Arenicella sp.]